MPRKSSCVLAICFAACSNSLPPQGNCDVSNDGKTATVTAVHLGASAYFDDLWFAAKLRKVIALPIGTGHMYLIDPDSFSVVDLLVERAVASADANASTIFFIDRAAASVTALDAMSYAQLATGFIGNGPDYIRVAPTTGEVWITLPGANKIGIFDPQNLMQVGSINVSSAEGLVFDSSGRAYTQNDGNIIAIDVASRSVVGTWSSGCAGEHGFPQVDNSFGLVVAGCDRSGGAAVLRFDGAAVSGYQAGGDETVLGYNDKLHHLYLRGDPSDRLAILGVCRSGETAILDRFAISSEGHAMAVDDRGHVWVADATTGG
jgi:DNA-binding beta-propeller fold protein YncE